MSIFQSRPNRFLALVILSTAAILSACGAGGDSDQDRGDETMSNDASLAIEKLLEGPGDGQEVVTTASGLSYVDLAAGAGEAPQPGQTCSTHATLWLLDGTKVWSSRDDGRAFDFVLGGGGVIAGWDEGVSTMLPGGTRRMAVPSELGYGSQGRAPIPPDATLIFEIELLEIK